MVGFVHSLCRRRTTTGWTVAGRVEWSGRAGTDLLDQLGDLLVNLSPFLHLAGDLVDGVDHGCVITIAEDPPDGRIAVVREFSGQVHGDLAGCDERPGSARGGDRVG